MAAFKKVLRSSWLGKQYAIIEGKENNGFAETPSSKRTQTGGLSERKHNTMESNTRPTLRRNTSVTQSVRDVVGSFRQKLKKTTRQRKRLQDSPCTPGFKKKAQTTSKRTPTRRGGYREVKMYSPFSFETPDRSHFAGTRREPMKWFDYETPSKLRKEVEDLTSNMQAMMALTPRTLKSRSSRRSLVSSPPTNGGLKSPNINKQITQTRKRIPTTVL